MSDRDGARTELATASGSVEMYRLACRLDPGRYLAALLGRVRFAEKLV